MSSRTFKASFELLAVLAAATLVVEDQEYVEN